jgi:hypothetical protein
MRHEIKQLAKFGLRYVGESGHQQGCGTNGQASNQKDRMPCPPPEGETRAHGQMRCIAVERFRHLPIFLI